ncbi:hypothetical protein [Burkholderia pseudomallei]|uniref:hypothetical protein n=1 Tax=Burkholderia pseudomallei TaxID=28450 RepID=UPI0024DFCBCD|nr:hypothetical protein [Burkholderia pseudomallei]
MFKLYTSAEVHTKKQAVIPKALFLLPIGAVLFVVLAVKVYHKAQDGFGVEPVKRVEPVASTNAATAARPADAAKSAEWRVAGRYSVDGANYVVLVAPDGRLRTVLAQRVQWAGRESDGGGRRQDGGGLDGCAGRKNRQTGGVK